MMKNILAVITLVLFSVSFSLAQQLSPRTVAKSANMEVTYGQPSKRNRVIFGTLVPYGEVWRTGANEATIIEFKKDAVFGGKAVKKGRYALFTIPEVKEWKIILNSDTEQWGAYEYDKKKGSNIAEITVPVQNIEKPREKLTIQPTNNALNIEWDNTGVTVPVQF